MNINGLLNALGINPEMLSDPSPGNVTVGSAKLSSGQEGIYRLKATQAVTQEERTLPDPLNAGIRITLALFSTAGANLRVNADTAFDSSAHTHALFTAANQTICFESVPIAGGTQPKFRWAIVCNDGLTLS